MTRAAATPHDSSSTSSAVGDGWRQLAHQRRERARLDLMRRAIDERDESRNERGSECARQRVDDRPALIVLIVAVGERQQPARRAEVAERLDDRFGHIGSALAQFGRERCCIP